jgi:AcrR family transcriptional regulator
VQRARSTEAKAIRRASILDATASVFRTRGPALTLDDVAASAGLTRATLYGYATTREELLVLLTERELVAWFTDVELKLRRATTTDQVAAALTTTLLAKELLAPLLALCGPVLEANVSVAVARRWKLLLHDELLRIGALIDNATRADAGSGARLLLHVHATYTGLHSLANPPEIAAKAIAELGLTALRISFADELTTSIRVLTTSLLHSSEPVPSPAKASKSNKRKAMQ